ncbi:MAG TPA: FAD-binding protein [Bryobacteraceae bacterium]|nr:FAD-binding protein [Bryobacteraceae bacterium]
MLMEATLPRNAEELADAVGHAGGKGEAIELGGLFSKHMYGGPRLPDARRISTAGMSRVLIFEPRDLTISVEAGLKWADLTVLLAQNGMMVPLDPPFSDDGTVGGVVAANVSGPRRRGYGTARDLVIGMRFATLDGKLIQAGGMVVKNVAGLDISKLMIGSFGTLGAIAVVNFKLIPMPSASRTFLLQSESLEEILGQRDRIIRSVMQPVAADILNPAAAKRVGLQGYCFALQAAGNTAMLDRWGQELDAFESVSEDLWTRIREFTPAFLRDHRDGVVVRTSATLTGLGEVLARSPGSVVSRAANGVCYQHFSDPESVQMERQSVIEAASERAKQELNQWPEPGSAFPVMERVKLMFDPGRLLNRGRLYGRI